MKLYTTPGYVLIESPETYDIDACQYTGKVMSEENRMALYFLGNSVREFWIDEVKYHSVPLSNVLCFWDCEG